jgi:hypothetical protein
MKNGPVAVDGQFVVSPVRDIEVSPEATLLVRVQGGAAPA